MDLARRVMKFIREKTHQASSELAEERGNFPEWENSIYKEPMRNSAPVTIAPTGTISIIAGASSGIEPLFAISYVRNVMDGTKLIEVNPYFEAVAHQEGFHSQELMEQVAETGSLEKAGRARVGQGDLSHLPRNRAQVARTDAGSLPEAHTDNSVSKTINLSEDATREDVRNAYLLAYMTNCNGITVYRDGSKREQVLSTSGSRKASPAEAGRTTPLDRPRLMNGVTERFRTGHGNMYVTLNFGDDGRALSSYSPT